MVVLVVRAGALGDVLLLRRAIASLHAAGHRVHLLAPSAPGAALLGAGPSEVRHLLPWDAPEAVGLFDDSPRPAASRLLDGIETAVAFTRSEDLARNLRARVPVVVVRDPMPAGGTHAARWYAAALADLGLSDVGPPAQIKPTAAEASEARRLLRGLPPGFVAVHPGSGSAGKNWPADRFADLIEDLREPRFLLVQGPADRGPCRLLAARHPGAVLADSIPLRVLGAALAAAGAFVGNDAGVTHLAAAWGAPTVALFGPTDPAVWAPEGARVLVAPGGDLSRLDVAEVMEALRAVRVANSF